MDWESCMTVSDKWGYNRYDTNIKSPETIIENWWNALPREAIFC